MGAAASALLKFAKVGAWKVIGGIDNSRYPDKEDIRGSSSGRFTRGRPGRSLSVMLTEILFWTGTEIRPTQ